MNTSIQTDIAKVCINLDTEVKILQSLCETMFSSQKKYQPMATFYSDSSTRFITLTISPQTNFEDSLIRLSEILHLYSAINAQSAIVSLTAKVNINDNSYESLMIFILSEEHAWHMMLPYTFDSDQNVHWLNDHFETNEIYTEDHQNISKDMMNIFFLFTHTTPSPYSTSEVLSYLSATGATATFHTNEEISFYDFSTETNPFILKE